MSTNPDVDPSRGERRDFFRIDDVLPVVLKKCVLGPDAVKAKICSVCASQAGLPPELEPGQDVSPQVWQVLMDIQAKVNLILEKLCLQEQGLGQVAAKRVSLSASGLSVHTEERFEAGDFLEVQMLLTLAAPVWVMVYGQVTRCEPLPGELNRIAIHFSDMDEAVRDLITQHALRRQREMIRKKRGYDDPWAAA